MNGLALCAGAAGLEIGLHLVLDGYRTVGYVEHDSYAASALVARMEDAALDRAPVWDDLRTFDGGPWRGLVDCVSAGYPCQPESSAGKRLSEADPRYLWPAVRRIVDEIRPALVVGENVAAHLGRGFRGVRADLHAMGFRVAAGVFSAAEVGAPHLRKRLFFVAAHPDRLGLWDERGERQGGLEDREGRTFPVLDGASRFVADSHGLRKLQPQGGESYVRGWAGDGGDAQPAPDADGERRHAGEFDVHAWQSDAARCGWWDAEPGVGRVADGVAHRVDRLRLCGNGVVPVQAAVAVATLWHQLSCELGGVA